MKKYFRAGLTARNIYKMARPKPYPLYKFTIHLLCFDHIHCIFTIFPYTFTILALHSLYLLYFYYISHRLVSICLGIPAPATGPGQAYVWSRLRIFPPTLANFIHFSGLSGAGMPALPPRLGQAYVWSRLRVFFSL